MKKVLWSVMLLIGFFGLVACCPGCDNASDEEPATEEVENQVEEVETPDTDPVDQVEEPEVEEVE